MSETRPTVYVCTSCGYSSRVFRCDPDLAHHDGVSMSDCDRCDSVEPHRVWHLDHETDHGREFQMPGGARGKGS